jgi:hypothetical protein
MAKSPYKEDLKDLLYPGGRQKDIYRKISFPFVKLVLKTGISADAIQLVRLLLCLGAAALFFSGN